MISFPMPFSICRYRLTDVHGRLIPEHGSLDWATLSRVLSNEMERYSH
ncbi:MAG: hypothetical protein NTY42_10355 [Planctomycetota bacterium]|nr:hypothetical protein [Planctomycetota bacterium]